MTIQFIKKDRYHIDFSSNQQAKGNNLSTDIKKAFHEYISEFSLEIKSQIWDHFAVEFWFDSGQLILFPEKKLNETLTEYDHFPADRLDPYLIIRLTSYLKKYDTFIEYDYDKLSDSEFEEWHLKNCQDVFNALSLSLIDSEVSNSILMSFNRKKIVFIYFGASRELKYGEKTIILRE
ncbi:hypothetical protein [Acinetobacter nectaris]|uniref:hypothetical protein n=1 Tax=Acinetobacter nectaris TaxID=1219382 RepID=UPI001F2CDF72|nr:hypothetical protein [Acinetobacter nectaris]MCF9047432.1 hypothetical protein [Acinetobacter nectaris]